MKFFSKYALAAAFVQTLAFGVTAQIVSPPTTVTSFAEDYGYKGPKIGINSDGNPVVFWYRTGADEAFFISTKDGNAFTLPIEVPLNGVNPNIWGGSLGPDMAAKGNHIYITFEKYGDAIYVVHSGDNGTTWDNPVACYTPPTGRKATIPNISIDNDGHPLVTYVNTNNNEGDAHYGLVKSTDFGATFSAEVTVNTEASGDEVCECCDGDIDVGENGDIYVAFRNNNNGLRDNWIARSTDGGISFGAAYDMDQTDWLINACPTSGPSVLALDNSVISTFYSAASDWENGSYFASLNLLDETVGTTISVPKIESETYQNHSKIAGHGDTLAIVCENSFGSSPNIALTLSTTGESGLSANSIAITNTEGAQKAPSIAYHNGIFHIVYQDNETDNVMYVAVDATVTGIKDPEPYAYTIYPNPAEDYLRIELLTNKPSTTILIHDTSGRVIKTINMSDNVEEIYIGEMASGIYTLTMEVNSFRMTRKFVKR